MNQNVSPEAQVLLDALETGGALLINKHPGVSSFGLIEDFQRILCEHLGVRRKQLPKMGHGGTLDPFATGLLIVCVGRAVKLARYFLGSGKVYEGQIRFGETTVPGDPTAEISERSDVIPQTREAVQDAATRFTQQPYLQTPPMHSAKKKDGKPLYELAREGIEIEREPKLCHIYSFEILSYTAPTATFRVSCSSGTYIRTLTQDLGRMMGTVAMLDTLNRTGSGIFSLAPAGMTLEQIRDAVKTCAVHELPCWIPFDQLLRGYDEAEATESEAEALIQGRQAVLPSIMKRAKPKKTELGDCVVIYGPAGKLVAVARMDAGTWGIERVFAGQG